MKKLKPVIFVQGDKQFYRKNEYAQTILLKALSEGITDPHEMRKVAGLNTVADVYRTLDKLAIRREYHDALARQGVSLDEIVGGIKDLCASGKSDSIRLKAYQTLMRSLGLDKYEKLEESGKTWEEVIIKATEDNKGDIKALDAEFEEYKVNLPETPKADKERQEREKAVGKQLYEDN